MSSATPEVAAAGSVDPLVRQRSGEDDLLPAYLAELGVELRGGPSAEQLALLHRAQVLRFGHDTVWKSRGRVPELTEAALVRALVAGEGGGCVHLSAAFVWLLRRLGYAATLHRARVQWGLASCVSPRPDAHAVVLVGLEGTTWHCDVGLGNGPLDCVPLEEGLVRQPGGFTYALVRSAEPGRWLFRHDRRLTAIRTVDLEEEPVELEAFAEGFAFDSSDPASPSLRHLSAARRGPDGVTALSGRTWVEHGPAGRRVHRLEDAAEWERLLRERFDLRLPGLTDEERERLWAKAGGADLPVRP